MTVRTYLKPASVDEAAALLAEHENAVIVGGGAYLRLGGRNFEVAVDLFDAGLDYVRESEAGLELGAMATYRMLETDPAIRAYADGVLVRAVERIVGVQMRNLVTVGGTIFGRFAFSNLATALLALDAEVVLHRAGRLSLADFLGGKPARGDILVSVVLPADGGRAAWQELTRTRNDFAVLNVAAVRRGDDLRIAVGARPGVACLCPQAAAVALAEGAARAGEAAAAELEYGEDVRASADYRRAICPVLVARAVEEVLS
jgi:CO/xanthine dehydrogenase FAD-binding subunit